MKSILLTAVLLAASTLYAQNDLRVSDAEKEKLMQSAVSAHVMPFSLSESNKTANQHLDTLDGLYEKFLTTGCLGSSLSLGTGDTIELTSGAKRFASEFGTTFNVPASTADNSGRRITEVYAMMANGTRVVGTPDEFRLIVYNNINFVSAGTHATTGAALPRGLAGGSNAPSVQGFKTFTIQELSDEQDVLTDDWQPSYQVGETSTFSPDDMYDLGNRVFFTNEEALDVSGNIMITFEVLRGNSSDGITSDDTLRFIWPVSSANEIYDLCTGTTANESFVRLRNPDNFGPTSWNNIRTFYGRNDSAGVIMLAPVVETYEWPASRDEVLLDNGGMKLYTHYPNPAVTHTTLRFDSAQPTYADIRVMDIAGRTVRNMKQVPVRQGENDLILDVSDLECGNYIYTIQSGSSIMSSKITVVR